MQLPLTQGAYQTRSVIASAQRSVNLYAEKNAPDSPFPFTYYHTPGLTPLADPTGFPHRCAYRASNGSLYEVIGPNVYYTNRQWQRTKIGSISPGFNLCFMQDNGLAILLVDGTANGYAIDLGSNQFAPVSGQNGAFYGSDFVDIVDGFFLLSRPGTNIWYISLSNVSFANLTGTVSPDATAAAFDPLDIATKSGYPDAIQQVRAMHNEPWLIGQLTTEVWNDAGNPDFAFQRLPGVFIEHGAAAPYSVAKADLDLFWLSQDEQGQCMVLQGSQYAAKRVTTHAIEAQFAQYGFVADAIGFTYLQEGHVTYQLSFPAANATWCFDVSQGPEAGWFEKTWTDANGNENRHRANTCCFVYGVNVVGDWQTGALYQLDLNNGTDFGGPIVRRRGWPIITNENKRISYPRLILDIEVAGNPNDLSPAPPLFGETFFANNAGGQLYFVNNSGKLVVFSDYDNAPGDVTDDISLRWSDSRGKSWGNPLTESIGSTGDDLKSIAFRQLGMARTRVYEAFWALPYQVALNGAFAEMEPAET